MRQASENHQLRRSLGTRRRSETENLNLGNLDHLGGEDHVKNWRASRSKADDQLDGSSTGRRCLRRRPLLPSLLIMTILAAVSLFAATDARAQRTIEIGAAKRTAIVPVYIGKSEDVRTDTSFVEITVGDPDVADVNPLTDRSLSILGKKSGTSRVSVYAEGKKLIGVFDVEVRFDTSMLASELKRRFPHARLRVTAVNNRILMSGT